MASDDAAAICEAACRNLNSDIKTVCVPHRQAGHRRFAHEAGTRHCHRLCAANVRALGAHRRAYVALETLLVQSRAGGARACVAKAPRLRGLHGLLPLGPLRRQGNRRRHLRRQPLQGPFLGHLQGAGAGPCRRSFRHPPPQIGLCTHGNAAAKSPQPEKAPALQLAPPFKKGCRAQWLHSPPALPACLTTCWQACSLVVHATC